MEEWKPVKGFEGKYEVSSLGRVKSLNYNKTGIEKMLKPQKDKDGYERIGLFNGTRQVHIYVHRIVAEAFVSNPSNYTEVNHKDENPSNNIAENLEWCNHKYNMHYGTRTERASRKQLNKHGSKAVAQYDENMNLICTFPSTKEAMRQTGIHNFGISKSCQYGCKSHGYFWKFV